jgi:hypothetical protein
MYCPKCGAELVAGVTWCGECDVAPVEEPPPQAEPQYQELVRRLFNLEKAVGGYSGAWSGVL